MIGLNLVSTRCLQAPGEEVGATSVARTVTSLATAHHPAAKGPEVEAATSAERKAILLGIAPSPLVVGQQEVAPVTSVGRQATSPVTALSSHRKMVSTVLAFCRHGQVLV